MNQEPIKPRNATLSIIGQLIFWSRWLQAPLYLGLIVAQCVFINAENISETTIKWQVAIHLTFLVSAMAMAYTDRIMTKTLLEAHGKTEH